jgi:hypothetical protein
VNTNQHLTGDGFGARDFLQVQYLGAARRLDENSVHEGLNAKKTRLAACATSRVASQCSASYCLCYPSIQFLAQILHFVFQLQVAKRHFGL